MNGIPPPSILTRESDEIHVWLIPLDLLPNIIQKLELILSPDEKLRAHRFKYQRHRRRYIVRHAILRKILGKYTGCNPSQLQFLYEQMGKPVLVSNGNIELPSFNLSGSNEIAGAVTLKGSVGVDIEFINPNTDWESLAKHFFSVNEYKTILSFAPDQRQNAFFDLWTLKEAYLKATGEGIGGLEQVEFSITSDKTPELINNGKGSIRRNWKILQLMPMKGYTAGLAVEGKYIGLLRFYKL